MSETPTETPAETPTYKECLNALDIIKVDKWIAPKPDEDPIRIIVMPNICKPLHTLAPRTIFPKEWNRIRRQCYADADHRCEVCGYEMQKGLHAHELYSYDYSKGEVVFIRAVGLCPRHHISPGVHTGRALTLYKRGDIYMSKRVILEGLESMFSLVHNWNTTHPEAEPLRFFHVICDYLKEDSLRKEVWALIQKYDISFYKPKKFPEVKWKDWHLVYRGKNYYSKFKDIHDWEEQMGENKSAVKDPFASPEFDDIKALLKEQGLSHDDTTSETHP